MGGGGIAFAVVIILAVVFGGKIIGLDFGGGGGGSSTAADAASSSDAAALLKSGRTHDSESYVYGGGHPPGAYSKGDGLDCSGLIDVAVMDVTGIKKDVVARDFRNDGNWTKISFSEARAGDIVYLLKENHPGHSDDHVAFVVKNGGSGKLTVFEAATSHTAQSNQIRESSGRNYNEWDGALRFHR